MSAHVRQGDAPAFVPCSPRHRSCSRWHAELVRSYRCERERQEDELIETVTYGYAGDHALWRASGGRLITFREWLSGMGCRAVIEEVA